MKPVQIGVTITSKPWSKEKFEKSVETWRCLQFFFCSANFTTVHTDTETRMIPLSATDCDTYLKSTSAVRSAVPGSQSGSNNLCSRNACQPQCKQPQIQRRKYHQILEFKYNNVITPLMVVQQITGMCSYLLSATFQTWIFWMKSIQIKSFNKELKIQQQSEAKFKAVWLWARSTEGSMADKQWVNKLILNSILMNLLNKL